MIAHFFRRLCSSAHESLAYVQMFTTGGIAMPWLARAGRAGLRATGRRLGGWRVRLAYRSHCREDSALPTICSGVNRKSTRLTSRASLFRKNALGRSRNAVSMSIARQPRQTRPETRPRCTRFKPRSTIFLAFYLRQTDPCLEPPSRTADKNSFI